MSELEQKAPLLLQIMSSIVSTNDHRNQHKVGVKHYPGICMATGVLLKERNREICGIQSLLSLLLFLSHAEKKVKYYHTKCIMHAYIVPALLLFLYLLNQGVLQTQSCQCLYELHCCPSAG